MNQMVNENTLTLMQNVIIKSNFNIPDTNIFYRNDYPQIQYLPFGSVDTSDALRLYVNNIEFDDDINDISIANTLANNGITAYTNQDGYIEYPEIFQHITSAELTIQSQYETITYSYTILVPYEITRVAYDRKSYITYNIIVYDKDRAKIVHRVVDVKNINNEQRYYTKGDANKLKDEKYVTNDNVIGKVLFRIQYLGNPTLFLRNIFK